MKEWLSKYGLSWAILIGIVSLIVIIITQPKQNNDSLYQYQLQQARDSAKQLQPYIDSLTKVINKKDDQDYAHLDSVLHSDIEANTKTVYELKKNREKINTDTLTSSDLLRFYSSLR